MRKTIVIATGLAALATAGLAVAGFGGATSARAVAGTFTATTVSANTTRTCTTTDGKTIAVTRATYSGTAAGDPDLAGPITVDARSVVNTTDDVGVVVGRIRIDVSSGEDTFAHFQGVYDHGRLAGLASGYVQDVHARLIANLSAAFSTSGGFTDGKVGSSTGGSAVELGAVRCQPSHAQSEEKSVARGTVSALSQTSITVGGLTCTLPATVAAQVNNIFEVGERAQIRCAILNGQNTLVQIKRR
jgi:hypothetical protein